jgi:hypothetical protein
MKVMLSAPGLCLLSSMIGCSLIDMLLPSPPFGTDIRELNLT